jgi:hypothetical protein
MGDTCSATYRADATLVVATLPASVVIITGPNLHLSRATNAVETTGADERKRLLGATISKAAPRTLKRFDGSIDHCGHLGHRWQKLGAPLVCRECLLRHY